MTDSEHYLKTELYKRIQTEPELFDWVEHGSLDGLWFWDLQNPEQEWLSPTFKNTFGYRDEEIPNTSQWWQDNIFPEDLPGVLENFEKHCADPNHPYDQIVRYRHKDGSTVWVRCRGLVMFDEQNKPVRMVGAHTNVTPLMEAREELLQREKALRRSNEDLEAFARVASHDLKAPLRGIKQLAEWVGEELSDVPDQVQSYLDLMHGRITRMETLLDDLLRYARVGVGQKGRFEELECRSLLEGLFSFLSPPENFQLDLVGDMPMLWIQKTPLEQVLRNLMGNAIKHRQGADGILSVWVDELDDHYVFHVGDDGDPIPENLHSKMFEMFQTLRPRDEVEGSGMGLTISQKLVEAQGGKLLFRLTDEDAQINQRSNHPPVRNEFYFTWPKADRTDLAKSCA